MIHRRDEVYIHDSSHERQVRILQREALKYPWLSIHIRDPMMESLGHGIYKKLHGPKI
jgi:hypothetical protein